MANKKEESLTKKTKELEDSRRHQDLVYSIIAQLQQLLSSIPGYMKLLEQGLDEYLNKKSGMLGISGVSSDFRDLVTASDEGNVRAELALEIFGYSVKKYIGSYMAAMNGLDAIIFTAGVGENTWPAREKVLKNTDALGIDFDFELNKIGTYPNGTVKSGDDADGKFKTAAEVSKPGSKIKVLIIPTDEELMIAQETAELINA